MKIGIITTHYANNYGALLQAFALQTFLNEKLQQDTECIAYYPPWHRSSWTIYHKPQNIKDFILMVYTTLNLKASIGFYRRAKKNIEFRLKYIRKSLPCYNEAEVKTIAKKYNCLICGSDQIWNLQLRDDPIFFLNFARKMKGKKKLSYAPSIADSLPQNKMDKVSYYLENLDAISVRESSDIEVLKKITEKKITHVLDPVFLISEKRWEKIIAQPKIESPYILCYFLAPSDFAFKAAHIFKKMTGYKLVHININPWDKIRSDICIWDASPLQFLGYIKNASLILTNSFHCTAFSIIFKKDFYTLKKNRANARIESIMKMFHIEDRILNEKNIDEVNKENIGINYCNYEKYYRENFEVSLNYLKNALGLKI